MSVTVTVKSAALAVAHTNDAATKCATRVFIFMLHAADLAWAQSELEPFAPADADRHDFRVPEVTSCERPLAIARALR
jgi:hypothetical protein